MQDILTTIKTTFGKDKTLQVSTSISRISIVTVFLLIMLMTFGEVIAREKSFQSLFIAPGIGSPNRQFEKQFGRLERIVEEEGKVDCIIIGSSTVQEGFNPLLFRSAFNTKTGKDFSCFNFGVDGLTAVGAGVISRVLVEKYQPQILIYGTEPRDFTYPSDALENTIIIDSPWIQHQLGKSNLLGWLFEHSYLIRYQEPIREALHLQFYRELRRYQDWQDAAKWGYLEIPEARVSVTKPPNQNTDTNFVKIYSELLSNYRMYPESLVGLEQVVSQQKNGAQVLVLEMPVAPGYVDFFPNGSKDYETFIKQVSDYLKLKDVPFLRPQLNVSIPIDGWTDYNHLNKQGTMLFSEWLGMKVGEMYLEGAIPILVP